jgi:hypothetical protein
MRLGKFLRPFSTEHILDMLDPVSPTTIANWRHNRGVPQARYRPILRGMLQKTEEEFDKILGLDGG